MEERIRAANSNQVKRACIPRRIR